MQKILFTGLLLVLFIGIAQSQNFSLSPEKPKPGDILTITYEPAGDLANTTKAVEAMYQIFGYKKNTTDDITLTRNGTKYSFTLPTDTSAMFVFFGFSVDGKFDNNFNNGYWVQFYDGANPRKNSYFQLALFYQFFGGNVGLERNNEKAFEAMEKEVSLYPGSLKEIAGSYFRLMGTVKKEAAPAQIQKTIENQLKAGIIEEADYTFIEDLYSIAKLPQQAQWIKQQKKEKFPNGLWAVSETINKFYETTDLKEKEKIYQEIAVKTSNDKNWEKQKTSLPYFQMDIANAYLKNKQYDEFRKIAASLTDINSQIQLYNSAAWEMQKINDNLSLAAEFSAMATSQAKKEWIKPSLPKPDYLTTKRWNKNREMIYAMYADTYAMVEFKRGNYKKGMPFAKEAAITINKGKDADQNNTYSLLAEKVLPYKQYKKEIEQFIKDGKATSDMKDILQRAYVKEKGSEDGFMDYITALQKENYLKMLEELRKSMLSETTPAFALLDMSGKKLDITELRGKVVVVDFWATWCGPCKASFPGMQKMVTKYKDNQEVKFIFIDTWERGDEKEKNAMDFITTNKYSFHVLMDNENKVVEQFKVEGIPTKFVIDKNGVLRFKAVGFDGSDEKLIQELTAMIDMAEKESSKKGF